MWGRPRSSRPASRRMAVSASTRRMPRRKPWASPRRNARRADPMWFRSSRSERHRHGSTLAHGVPPRWSRAVAHEPSANGNRGRPVIPTSSAAPSAMPPFGTAIPDALTGPTPGGHPPVPVAAVAVPDNARAPWRSRSTRRLDVRRASHGHTHSRIHARSSGPPYRPSDATPAVAGGADHGRDGGRSWRARRPSRPPRSSRGRGRPPSVPTGDTRAMPRTTPRRLPDPRRGAGSTGRADGSSGAESSVTTAPDRRRTCGPASVRSVAGSGSRRPGRRAPAASARRAGSVGRNAGGLRTRTHVRSRGQDSDGIAGGNVRCAQAPRSNPEPPRADDPARRTA